MISFVKKRVGIHLQDTQWGDIDYMYKKFDFTYDRTTFAGLPQFVNEVHDKQKKFVVIVVRFIEQHNSPHHHKLRIFLSKYQTGVSFDNQQKYDIVFKCTYCSYWTANHQNSVSSKICEIY